ncbi:hypothetical protein D030_5337B, partial [Vibrio parahaemolyticus AQ3810]
GKHTARATASAVNLKPKLEVLLIAMRDKL